MIDIHSHLGDYPTPSVDAHSDGNEATSPMTPEVWAEHSVWPQDPGFTRALAMDLSANHICVNSLCPSMIASPLNISLAEDGDIGPQWAKDNLAGRWGQPEDVAKVAAFLASDDADYVTGSEYRVDGGEATGLIRAGEMDL